MKIFNKVLVKGFIFIFVLFLNACSQQGAHKPVIYKHPKTVIQEEPDGPPLVDRDVTDIPNATPQAEPFSKYGNPSRYQIGDTHYHVMPHNKGYDAEGHASWYGRKFHGRRTSSGERYDMFGMTAAHPNLPIPTYAKVKNLNNGKEVIVKINDRGPFLKDRLIDLSYAAAKKLGFHQAGTAKVRVTAIDPQAWHRQQKEMQMAKVTTAKKKATGKKGKPITVAKNNKSKKSVSAHKQVYVQLGAFTKKGSAQQLADKASTLTQALTSANVHILPGKKASKDLYKVRIGPLKNEQEAQSVKEKLLALSDTNSFSIVYE